MEQTAPGNAEKGGEKILSLRLEKQGLEEKILLLKKRKKLIIKTLGQLGEKESENALATDADVRKALKKNVCSFIVTGTSKVTQSCFSCVTW
mgnify:FL=1